MTIHMIRLYIRLVTDDRLHILTSVICLQLFYLSFICTLIHVIVIQCLFIMLFSVCVICYYFVHTVYMHEQFSLHTHSPGRFLTTLDLHVQILDTLFLLCRCSMRLYALRGLDALSFDSGILFFLIPAIIL